MSLVSKFNPLGGAGSRWDEKHYSFEASIPSDNYAFTLRVATSDKAYTMDATDTYINPITVDWGDGTTEEYSSGDMSHTYTTQGDYKITVLSTTGNMPYFTCSPTGVIKRILTPLLTCYTGNNPRKTFDEFLRNESNCRSLPRKFFVKNSQITSMNSTFQFYGWIGQMYIPSDLFHYTPNVTDMRFLFSYARFRVLPDGIFDKCTEVTTFASALNTFYGINTMSSNIFDKCTKVTDFSTCFGSVSSNVTLPRLWERTNVTNYSSCFQKATAGKNYTDVPYDWGGPSRVTFNVTPSDATIECTVPYGQVSKVEGTTYMGTTHYSSFKYKIYKEGYVTQEGTVDAGENTLDIVLQEKDITVTVNPNVDGVKVFLTAYGETTEGNSIKVAQGADVSYDAVSTYYGSKQGTIANIQANTTKDLDYTEKVTLYTLNTSSDELQSGFDLTNVHGDDTTQDSIFFTTKAFINQSVYRNQDRIGNYQNTAHIVVNPISSGNPRLLLSTACKCKNFTGLTSAFHFGESNYTLTKENISSSTPASDGQFVGIYTTTTTDDVVEDSNSIALDIDKDKAYYLNMFVDAPTQENSSVEPKFTVGVNYLDILIDKPEDWEQYKLGFEVTTPNTTITLKYKDAEYTFTNGESYDVTLSGNNIVYFDKKIDKNTLVYYKVEKDGYYTVDGWTRIVEDNSIDIQIYPYINLEYTYPFDNITSSDKEALGIDNGSYAINSTLNALVSQSSYHKSYGTSYGYLTRVIHSRSNNPQLVNIEVDAYVSSQKNGDYGCIMIGNTQGSPTVTEMKNLTHTNYWNYIMCQSGTDNTLQTYSVDYNLMGESTDDTGIGEKYSGTYGNVYLSFGYAKNLLTNSGEDRLIITRIKMQTVEDSLVEPNV